MSSEAVQENPERASQAELLFAGHYLNIFGIVLLMLGLASYIRNSGAPFGLLEVLLPGGLGLALLAAGANFYLKGMKEFAQPMLAAGLCLDFFAVCSAHFRHHMISQGVLFGCMLMLVVIANIAAFRLNAKIIGTAMLVASFFAPVFITFHFANFSTIAVYLLAINLGSAAVAFYKKWDFQLIAASLGSYALYFAHFRDESPQLSLLMLFVVYTLSLVSNNLLYFVRPTASNYNLVLSFINPTAFALLSAVTILRLPNWVAVTAYLGLAAVHGITALAADRRRAHNENFEGLATGNLSLSLLFLCAAISFVTYFSNDTQFFGPVTLLLFALALTLQQAGIRIARHSVVLSRFSYFTLYLAAAQCWYVLPSMPHSGVLRAVSLGLYLAYAAVMLHRRHSLSERHIAGLTVVSVIGCALIYQAVTDLMAPPLRLVLLSALALAGLALPLQDKALPSLRFLPHAFAYYGFLVAFVSDTRISAVTAGLLVFYVIGLGFGAEKATACDRPMNALLIWPVLVAGKLCILGCQIYGLSPALVALAFHAALLLAATRLKGSQVLSALSFLPLGFLVLYIGVGVWSLPVYLVCFAGLAVCYQIGLKLGQNIEEMEMLAMAAMLGFGALSFSHSNLFHGLVLGVAVSLALWAMGAWRLGLFTQALLVYGVANMPGTLPSTQVLMLLALLVGSFVLSHRRALSLHAVTPLKRSVAMAGGLFIFLKLTYTLAPGTLSTVVWLAVATLGLLLSHREKLVTDDWAAQYDNVFDHTRILFILTFIKGVYFDANFGAEMSLGHFAGAALVAFMFLLNAHFFVSKREVRNLFVIAGLLIACFETAYLFHGLWGDRLILQPVLSGFWSLVGFLCVSLGIFAGLKVYRLFGLTTLVGNTAKILMVDIHVLDSYSQVNTYVILGVLLMLTSFLYQKQRHRLEGRPKLRMEEAVAAI